MAGKPDPARLAAIIDQIKREITEDVRQGTLPALPDTFSALNDHVDANLYGGLCAENADIDTDDLLTIQRAVQTWLVEQAIIAIPATIEAWLATQPLKE